MQIDKLEEVLPEMWKHGETGLLVGEPGIGKTGVIKALAEKHGYNLIVSHPAISQPTDFQGFASKAGDHAEFLPYGQFWEAIKATEPTIWFMDDMGQSSDAVQKALMQPLHERSVNGKHISDKVVFVGATNNVRQGAGVSGMIEPLKSRFHTIINVEVDVNSWTNWALKQKFPPYLIAFIRNHPDLLNKPSPSRDIKNSPNPRNWEHVGVRHQRGQIDVELDEGSVDKGAAFELHHFMKAMKSLPSIDDIKLNPDSVPIPQEKDLQLAVSVAIAAHANDNNIASFSVYLNRMEQPFRVMAYKDALKRKTVSASNHTIMEWVSGEGQDI